MQIDDDGVMIEGPAKQDAVFTNKQNETQPEFTPSVALWHTCIKYMRAGYFIDRPSDEVLVEIATRYNTKPVIILGFWKKVYAFVHAALAIKPADFKSLISYGAKIKSLSSNITPKLVEDFVTQRLKSRSLTLESDWADVVNTFSVDNNA